MYPSSTGAPNAAARKGPKAATRRIRLTILRNLNGEMTKRLSLSADGVVKKSPACALYDGEAERVAIDCLQDLAQLIARLNPNEALCYGVTPRERVRVVTQDALPRFPDAIARDREHFAFPSGPGLLMLDYDPTGEPLGPQEVVQKVTRAMPEFADVTMMWRPSASSCIINKDTGLTARGVCGLRIWIVVSDATKIPELGKILTTRLWARGDAGFAVSNSGQLLERPLFDASVWQPERIDFVAGAICEEPLEQRLPPPEIISGKVEIFDTGTLPVLTATEMATSVSNREAARQRLAPQAREVRAAWVAERARDLIVRRHIEPAVAEVVLNVAVEDGVLGPDFPLLSVKYGEVSVADVLADPDKFDSTRFADPLEPDYRDDPRIAYVSLKANAPNLYSHAHGGRRYALRARTAAQGDIIDELNERFGVVALGRNAYIVDHGAGARPGKGSIELLTRAAFDLLMYNRPRADGQKGHLGSQWLSSQRRKEYAGVEFNPRGTTPGYLNYFTGFRIRPSPGCTALWWAFVRDVICDGNQDAYRYVRRWLAHLFQKTGELPGTALVLRGLQGTGKNTFAGVIGKLVEPHFVELNSLEQVTGRFNGHMKMALLVHANEAIWGGSKQQVGTFKSMITDPRIAVEQKGIDITLIDNYRRVIVSSNEEWAVPADPDDRRFVFLNVSPARANDHAYFAALRAELDAGGYAALMNDLMTEDLTGFVPAERPSTGFGFDIKLRSAEPILRWMHDMLDGGGFCTEFMYGAASRQWPETVEKSELYRSYVDFYRRTETRRPETEAEFHGKVKKFLPSLEERRPRPEKARTIRSPDVASPARVKFPGAEHAGASRPRVYVLPTLEVARRDFEKLMRSEGMVPWQPIDREPTLSAVQDGRQVCTVQVVQGGQADSLIRKGRRGR